MNLLKRLKTNKWNIFCLFLIVIFGLIYWDINKAPKIFPDEYGYWAAASWFAGLKWSRITALNDYYSYGYGFLLSFILRLPISAEATYHLGIILNSVFLCGVFLVSHLLFDVFDADEKWNRNQKCAAVFMITVSSSNLMYLQFTMTETLLTLVYFLIIYILVTFDKEITFGKIAVLAVINIVTLSIHMRTMGIVFISMIVCFIKCLSVGNTRKKTYNIMLLIGIFVLGIAINYVLKNNYQGSYKHFFTEIKQYNDIGTQASRIQNLITINGMKGMIKNCCGRLFYSMISSYGIIGILGIFLIEKMLQLRKNGIKGITTLTAIEKMLIISGACFAIEVLIAAVYMNGFVYERFDIMVYGRYHEFTTGPLTLFCLLWLRDQEFIINKRKLLSWIIILAAMISIFAEGCTRWQDFDLSLDNLFVTAPIIYWLYMHSVILQTMFWRIALLLFIATVIMIIVTIKLKKLFVVLMIVFSIGNIHISKYAYENGCINWASTFIEEEVSAAKFIQSNNSEERVIVLKEDKLMFIDMLQFLLRDEEVLVAKDFEEAIDINGYVVVSYKYDKEDLAYAEQELVYSNSFINIYKQDAV